MRRARTFLFLFIVGFALFFIGKAVFANLMLPKYGQCIKAILMEETIRSRSSKPSLTYRFELEGKVYEGNSLEADLTKNGDSICVVYFGTFPSINRPIKYFEEAKQKCKCQ